MLKEIYHNIGNILLEHLYLTITIQGNICLNLFQYFLFNSTK